MQYVYYRNDEKLLVWNKQGSDAVGVNYRRIPEVTGDQTAATQLQEKTPVAGQILVEGQGRALLDTMIERVNQNPGALLASWAGAASHDQANFNWWFQDRNLAVSQMEEPHSTMTEQVGRDASPLVPVKRESATEVEIGRDYRFDLGGELGLDLVWTADLDGWVGKYEVTNAQYRKLKSGHNDWGLYGIAGNVWEWTSQSVENSRVVRGASWRSINPQNLSANYRYDYLKPATSHHSIGFRVILCR